MQFFDLQAQYKSLKDEIDRAVLQTLKSGQFILGRAVAELEEKIAQYCGVKYGIGVNSGTDALYLSLRALGIGRGDEVITSPFTFIATAETIMMTGARPVFADIDPHTYNVDPHEIEKKITGKTKAIIPVHLYGQPADMASVMQIARKRKLSVIEDAAQAFGASFGQQRAGSFGQLACLSFFPSKNLGACGDAGMVVTNSKKHAGMIRELRAHGSRKKYYHARLGVNSRLDAMQAAVLAVKLPYVDGWIKKRRLIAKQYDAAFSKITRISTPCAVKSAYHTYNQYTIRTGNRDALKACLDKRLIPTAVHYPLPLHLQPALKGLRYKKGDFPEAERAAREVLSLPIYPELRKSDQLKVIKAIRDEVK